MALEGIDRRLLSRREFLRLSGAAAAGLLLPHSLFPDRPAPRPPSLENLDRAEAPPHPLPLSLIGVTINSPFLWTQDETYIRSVAEIARASGATFIRIFIDDRYEPEIGKFSAEPIKGVQRLARSLQKSRSPIRLIVSLFDCYTLLHSDKGTWDYSRKPLSSPYFQASPGEGKAEKQLAFFIAPVIRSHFAERTRSLIKALAGEERIAAWEIANEPVIPATVDSARAKKILTQWYQVAAPQIRALDSRPIITGLGAPWLIDESELTVSDLVNSFHLYPSFANQGLQALKTYAPHADLPLMGLEIGVGDRIGGAKLLPPFLTSVVRAVWQKNTLYAANFGIWKCDNYSDGFDLGQQDSSALTFLQTLAQELAAFRQQTASIRL